MIFKQALRNMLGCYGSRFFPGCECGDMLGGTANAKSVLKEGGANGFTSTGEER
jgi:hypothetical protein